MHRHDLPHRGAHRFGMRRLKLARAKACDLRGHLQVKPLARRIFPHRGVPRQLQALKIQQSLAFRACVRRACQGLELRAEFPAHLNASFFCCLLYTWHQRRNWGHRCCGLKILTANKYLIDGSARRRPSRPLRWTHPNCWAFSTSTRGGAEKPSQPSPSVHETAPRPRHFNEGTGGYPGHSVRMRLRAVLSSTSTKGPGVYPGHFHGLLRPGRARPDLNEGTGSLSRSCSKTRCSARKALHLNEGTGSLSRSSPHRATCVSRCAYLNEGTGSLSRSCLPVLRRGTACPTSTKGPGVYPGHARSDASSRAVRRPQRRDREFIPVMMFARP